MKTKRPYYPKKWQWAEAQAEDLRQREASCRAVYVPGSDWRGVRGKMTALDALAQERRRFETMAQRLKARGI